MGKEQTKALREEVDKLLKAGFICSVKTAEWVSPVVVTPKKDGRWRVCVNFKPLNVATKKDPYPLPFIDQILDSVAGHERYSVCDGYSGYFQLKIAVEDQRKTTFITPWGCFCYTVLPFGLTNGLAYYQKRANWALAPFIDSFVKDFINDFCVYSTRAEHCEKLEMVLKRYDECGGQLNPKKCSFAQPRVKLLGHMLSENGIEADPDKVKAMVLLPSPKDSKQVATFVHKLDESKSAAEHLSLFTGTLSQLQDSGLPPFDDKLKAIFLLMTLPDSWETLVVPLSNNPNLTFDGVKGSILNEEIRRKASEEGGSSANMVRGRTKKKNVYAQTRYN
ncbi:hypothetical protein L7F22_024423 [Adiantum nelumboides]|nr:hypothetical protein [Adiantum nelumboides]